jgi:hypothetical protein
MSSRVAGNGWSTRRRLLAVLLALLAVGGVGAAVTSAAWTDNVFFSSKASAASFNLQGSLGSATGPWTESDDSANITLVVPAATFADLVPGRTVDVSLYVKNVGSVAAALTTSVAATGDMFTGTGPATATVTGTPASLAATGVATLTLEVAAPTDWNTSYQGSTGSIVVTVHGETTA